MNTATPYRFSNSLLTVRERAAVEARFPQSDWRYEVGNGDTRLGYEEWLLGRVEAEGLPGLTADADGPLFCIDAKGLAVFVGDTVEVAPKAGSFPDPARGRVCGFQDDGVGGFFVQVEAGDGEPLDCDGDQVTLVAGE